MYHILKGIYKGRSNGSFTGGFYYFFYTVLGQPWDNDHLNGGNVLRMVDLFQIAEVGRELEQNDTPH